jgi:hypothetical protein
VLLGASNVVLGFRCAVRSARERLGAPLEVFGAIGHGRSYGVESNVYSRKLPAITNCNLWPAMRERPPAPTFAVVTDLGNDLAYGFAPAQIENWLERALDQLAAARAQIVITGLPLAALTKLPDWEFAFFSHLFFPRRRIDRRRVTAAVEELELRVERLAREREIARVEQRAAWYGHDPIHIARAARRDAWRTFTGAWRGVQGAESVASFDAPWRQRGWLAPERRRLFGFEAGRAQPCARTADGTQFFLY